MSDYPIKRYRQKPPVDPFGYVPSPDDPKVYLPIPEVWDRMEEAFLALDNNTSLMQVAAWVTDKTGHRISHEGLRKLWSESRRNMTTPRHLRKQELARKRKPLAKKRQKEAYKKKIVTTELNRRKKAERKIAVPKEDEVAAVSAPAVIPVHEKDVGEVIFRPNPGPQTEFLAATEQEVLYGGAAGGGKGLPKLTMVLTPFGWKEIGKLSVGDKLCAVDGTVTEIIAYHDRGIQPCYDITMSDGSQIRCDADHLWLGWKAGKSRKIANERVGGEASARKYTTQQIYEHYQKDRKRSQRIGIPVISAPVSFNVAGTLRGPGNYIRRDFSPYVLGLVLGDGCVTRYSNATIATADDQIISEIERELGCTVSVYLNEQSAAKTVRIPSSVCKEAFDNLGLWGKRANDKSIPRIYLFGSEEERWALLQGLMDTDGWCEEDGESYFTTISTQLADDVTHLARSLGAIVTRTTKQPHYTHNGERKQGQDAYCLRIKIRDSHRLFRLERKKARCVDKTHQAYAIWIDDIQPAPSEHTVCISVSHPSSLFIIENFIVTHNSYALLADPMRYFHHSQFSGLLLRRTTDELRELIWKSQELYPKAFEGAKWSERKNQWMFSSGARFWLTYLERDEDVLRYQGLSFTWVGIDEAGQYATPFALNYLRSRLRTTASDLPLFTRLSANPGNVGSGWLRKMFIDPAPAGKAFWATDIDTGKTLVYPPGHEKAGQPLFRRRYIPARLKDNPFLAAGGQYEASLLSLPENLRRQLLEGDWSVTDGAAFSEFRPSVHTCEPFEIPYDWKRFRSCDFGYSSHSAVHWYAIDPAYETLYVYRELYVHQMTARQLAMLVKQSEEGERIAYGVLDSSCWHQRGQTGPSIAEEMISAGTRWRPSDRSPRSRVAGKMRLHELLQEKEYPDDVKRPGIVFFNTCRQIIADLPVIPADPKGSDDIDIRYASDHAYDSIRYGIMSRPRPYDPFDLDSSKSAASLWMPSDPTFGY